jgi:hypothetical protein
MKLFVFENVLWDYTSGMAIIAAESLEQAQKIAYDVFYMSWQQKTFEEWIESSGFHTCAGEYEVIGDMKAGVKHSVYGGA